MDMKELVQNLKAIADETRFKIINLLLQKPLCVKAIACRLNLSEPAISQHLKILRQANIVKGEKKGYWTHYSVNKKVLMDITNNLNAILETPFPLEKNCKQDCNFKCKEG